MDPGQKWFQSKKFLAYLVTLGSLLVGQALTIFGSEPMDGSIQENLSAACMYGLPVMLAAYGGAEYAKAKNGHGKPAE